MPGMTLFDVTDLDGTGPPPGEAPSVEAPPEPSTATGWRQHDVGAVGPAARRRGPGQRAPQEDVGGQVGRRADRGVACPPTSTSSRARRPSTGSSSGC